SERFLPKEVPFDQDHAPPVRATSAPKEIVIPPAAPIRLKGPTYAPLNPLPGAQSLPEPLDRTEPIHQIMLWINRAFDGTIGRLGSTGAWLQTKSGRRTLGWSGIALIAVAFAWSLAKLLG